MLKIEKRAVKSKSYEDFSAVVEISDGKSEHSFECGVFGREEDANKSMDAMESHLKQYASVAECLEALASVEQSAKTAFKKSRF